MEVKIVQEVIACDVSPVAMFITSARYICVKKLMRTKELRNWGPNFNEIGTLFLLLVQGIKEDIFV